MVKAHQRTRVSILGVALLALASALLVQSDQPEQSAAAPGCSATYAHGVLRATIPYARQRGEGRLVVEILNPEDEVVGRAERLRVAAGGSGAWQVEVHLAKPLAVEDLVWHRLRYRFTAAGAKEPAVEGVESISQILRLPVLHIVGQRSYLAGAEAAVRVVATNSRNQPISGESTLNVELTAAGKPARALFSGRLNARGTADVQFRMPAEMSGQANLHYAVETPIGSAEFTEPVRIEAKSAILLTTEKPIYQPGQTIHARALALDRANHSATAGKPLTFEVEDSRGNKVFRKSTQTDAYGIASAEFILADEVNLGTYHLRALMEGSNAEIALNVDRYVLPKFKVAVEFSSKGKHGYRPGEHVTGTILANYFFGKPVEGEVMVKASAMDVALFEAASAQGKTDADGAYRFDLKLPDYFAGRPLSQDAARVLVEATVKDTAGHAETRGEPIMVSQSPLLVTAVPEGGTLVPNLENQVFLLASYADGAPAVAELTALGQKVTTDAGGVAVIHLAAGTQPEDLRIEANDAAGNHATATVSLAVRPGADQVLLRTERAIYKAGERIRLHVLSTRRSGTAYIDVVKSGQTVETRDVDLVNGEAELSLAATPDLAGTLDCNAYIFGRDARPVADHRLLFVQPADELKIEATADRAAYKPGDDARVQFRVTNARGEGVQAAIGLQVVDEAVFALAEKQPGFAKVFFYLEQEALKPRYEIHGLEMMEAIDGPRRDLAARALFAATEMVNNNRFETEVGRGAPMGKWQDYRKLYEAQFVAEVKRSAGAGGDPMKGPLATAQDQWGTALRVQRVPWNERIYTVTGAGPDKRLDTADDFHATIDLQSGTAVVTRGGVFRVGGLVRDGIGVGVVGGVAGGVLGGIVGGVPGGIGGGGGGANGPLNGRMMRAMAGPMVEHEMAPMAMMAESLGSVSVTTGAPAPRVRSYFPEALYINPEIITDAHGAASISIPLADSITTWRMALMASTARGALGSATGALKVFQDFFVDLDLPVTLTQGDRVTIPVAVYNYSGARGDVGLDLRPADWFALVEDSAAKTVAVDAGRVGAAQFAIQANRIGRFKLTLAAKMGSRADIVVREIEVVPNGREMTQVFNGRLDSTTKPTVNIHPGVWQEADYSLAEGATVRHTISFPIGAIPDASTVMVRLYPGPLSQVIEGMDAILRMPFGCFEQTSSATYPNVLALSYMKRTNKLTPEVHAKAEGFIANGYQRLVTFEVPGGGFSWFGQAPANQILTAYGLMEFHDMAQVHDVDERLIARTQYWLASRQQPDGSWKPDTQFINEGATNRFNTDVLRITAYVAWALERAGYQGPAAAKARTYVESHLDGSADAYTLAVVANLAADSQPLQAKSGLAGDPNSGDREFTRRAIDLLVAARKEENDQAWWTAEETGVFGRGASAAVETTGLAVQALLKAGRESAIAGKALRFIASKKDATGAWGTTQATIMALGALLAGAEKGGADVNGTVEITLNGQPAGQLALTAANNDLLHQFPLKGIAAGGPNTIELRFRGTGGLAYQVAGRYFLPWNRPPAKEPLSITVAYDRTELAQNDLARATATVKSNLDRTAKMVMVDLGIPPGFDLLTEDLEAYQQQSRSRSSGRLEKFSLTPTQAILYFDAIAPDETVTLPYRLRAKYPIRAKTFASRVYEYYDPSVHAEAPPVELRVR